ncbi:MAG: T9SS type A sorting domain-containing protein [Saprospiraceae bacterium]|nr:T9SS type A sorting domain-containing protein [Saprospiraceae bacterium]
MKKVYLPVALLFALIQTAFSQIKLEHSYPRGYLLRTVLDVSGETWLFRPNLACDLSVRDSLHVQKLFIPVATAGMDCSNYSVTEKIVDGDPGIEVLYYWLDAGQGIAIGNTFLDDNGISKELGHGPVSLSRLPGVAPKVISRRSVLALPGLTPEQNYGASPDLLLARQVFPVDGERYLLYNRSDFDGFHFFDAQHQLVKTIHPPIPGFDALSNVSQHDFNQDNLLEFFGARKMDTPDAQGNCCRCEVVQENGNMLFSTPAQYCSLSRLPGLPDQILVQRYGNQNQWQTVLVDAATLQPIHTFEGRVERRVAPDGSAYFQDVHISGTADVRVYDSQFALHKTLSVTDAWGLGSTRGQFSPGNKFEFFFTTRDAAGKVLVRCVDENGALLYEFPGAKGAMLDRREGLADKFIVTYDHNDSIQVYRFDKSTGAGTPGAGTSAIVLPNPFRESLQVKLPEATDFRLTLYSVDGRLVRTQAFFQENQGALRGSGLASGVYFLQIDFGPIREVVRVVKME